MESNRKTLNKVIIGLLAFGFILLFIGMLLAYRHYKPITFNVIAACIVVGGTVGGILGKQAQDNSSSEKSRNILETGKSTESKVDVLQIQNNALSLKADKQAEVIDRLREENTSLYTKLAASSNNIFEQVTGGSNVPCISFLTFPDRLETIMSNVDKSKPVRNVTVQLTLAFVDVYTDLGNGLLSAPHSNQSGVDTTLEFNDLSPESLYNTQILHFPRKNNKAITYVFTVRWLNGFYHGGFTVNFQKDIKVESAEIINCTPGLDLKNKCMVFGHVLPPPKSHSTISKHVGNN